VIYWAVVANSDSSDTMSYAAAAFNAGFTNGDLTAIAGTGAIYNGTVGSHFYDNSDIAANSNYFVDVMFQP
jgi:hypothetical protein